MTGNGMPERSPKEMEEILQYQFQNKSLLHQALTHRSYVNEIRDKHCKHNERLEFLGDAVLELVTSDFLYSNNPEMEEGELSKLRASLVCEQTLSVCARNLELGNAVFLGKGEDTTGGRNRNSILSDALESIIGAIYLDGTYEAAKSFILKFILNDLEHTKLFIDSKTKLQEMVQNRYKRQLHYETVSEEGPDHDKQFTVLAMMDKIPLETGTGKSKKNAAQDAAYRSLLKLDKEWKVQGGTDVP